MILTQIDDPRALSMPARPLVGRDRIITQGLKDVYVVKSTIGAPIFPVTGSVDQATKRYILVNPPVQRIQDQLPFKNNQTNTPESGDYLVTIEGDVIGIFLSERNAYILDDSDAEEICVSLPLGNNAEFVQQAKALHTRTP